MGSRPLCLVLNVEHYRSLTGKVDATEVDFFKLFSQLQLEPILDDEGSYAIRYCGQDEAIHAALKEAALGLQRHRPKSRKRARLASNEENMDEDATTSASMQMAMVPYAGTRQTQPGSGSARQDSPSRCVTIDSYRPAHQSIDSYRPLMKPQPDLDGPRVFLRSHPGIPSETLAKLVFLDGKLSPLYDVHKHWFDYLLGQGFDKEFLYNKLYPCKQDSRREGCACIKNSRNGQHGIAVILFVTTAALIKWGFKNHRSVRRLTRDPFNFPDPTYTNVCISWALRNLIGSSNYGRCEEGPPKCATKAMHMMKARQTSEYQQMYHSFWMLEEWCLRVYARVPLPLRTNELKRSILVLGFDESILNAAPTSMPPAMPPAMPPGDPTLRIEAPRQPPAAFRTARPLPMHDENNGSYSGLPGQTSKGFHAQADQRRPWWVCQEPRARPSRDTRMEERLTEGRLLDCRPFSSQSGSASASSPSTGPSPKRAPEPRWGPTQSRPGAVSLDYGNGQHNGAATMRASGHPVIKKEE